MKLRIEKNKSDKYNNVYVTKYYCKCDFCGNEHIKKNKRDYEQDRHFCSRKCSFNALKSQSFKEHLKRVYISKYNVEYISQYKDGQEKKKQTFLQKYGVDQIFKSNEFKEKAKQSVLEKYGTENISNSDFF